MTRILAGLATRALAGQGTGIDFLSAGPLAVHDHIVFDYHFPIKGDPYHNESKEGYAFDGVDIGVVVGWHWGGTQLGTSFRAPPRHG
ncbi:MAG TPA: hypothetical protein VN515_05455 [Terriglobales bacterium]|nr:hypothetical protein [Terriglobales bacterium]